MSEASVALGANRGSHLNAGQAGVIVRVVIRAYPEEFAGGCLHTTQVTECSLTVVFEDHDTEGAPCLTLRRRELVCRLAVYEVAALRFCFLVRKYRDESFH
jgi:hypothetical protein